jgi:hypothetical protein
MAWLILGICILAAVLLVGRWFLNADPKTLATVVRWTAGLVGGLILVFLIISGRLAWALPLLFLAPMLLRRRRRMLGGIFRSGGFGAAAPSAGQTSEVETTTLRMVLDHDSGEMKGTVLRGAFAGRTLDSLSLEQVIALLRDCAQNDDQSVSVLESYLDRMHGEDWRDNYGGAEAGAAAGGAPMTRDEAYEILDLKAGASPQDIREAHHRLMLKLHPDQGGSTYLASKINQAKDLLLRDA